MVALLSASRLLAWRPCRVDACLLQILFTGKIQKPLERAIWLPEAVRGDHDSEVAGRIGDASIHAQIAPHRACRHVDVVSCRRVDLVLSVLASPTSYCLCRPLLSVTYAMNVFGNAVAFSSCVARRTKTFAATETRKITMFTEAIDKGHASSKATGRHQLLSLFIAKLPAGEHRVHVLDRFRSDRHGNHHRGRVYIRSFRSPRRSSQRHTGQERTDLQQMRESLLPCDVV
jgi:hypothetical protein